MGSGRVALLGGLLGMGLLRAGPPSVAARQAASINSLVWVWKFSADGSPREIRDTLAARRLGVLLKTHDGTSWMSEYDESPDAVTGPEQIAGHAATFEEAGVPFHAWCVVQGRDPLREAEMCAAVLQSGARSLFLDLEPSDGSNYWQGTAADAVTFGQELRRLAPDAWIAVAPDSRPWQAGAVPMAEFAAFSNAIAPQAYWETFQGPTNRKRFSEHGYFVGPEGVTPELVIDASVGTFRAFGRPIQPIGQGASSPDKWRRFIESARGHGIDSVSLWRYGASDRSAFDVLGEVAPQPAPPIAETTEDPVPVAVTEKQEVEVEMAAVQEPASAAPEPAIDPAAADAGAVAPSPHGPPASEPSETIVGDESPGDASLEGATVGVADPRDMVRPVRRTLDDLTARVLSGLGRRILGLYR